jgi:hypothetical protein
VPAVPAVESTTVVTTPASETSSSTRAVHPGCVAAVALEQPDRLPAGGDDAREAVTPAVSVCPIRFATDAVVVTDAVTSFPVRRTIVAVLVTVAVNARRNTR